VIIPIFMVASASEGAPALDVAAARSSRMIEAAGVSGQMWNSVSIVIF
jgi:hypothetical protein